MQKNPLDCNQFFCNLCITGDVAPTMSELCVTNFPTYIPGSTVIAMFLSSFVPDFRSAMHMYINIPCPVECMNCFPNPVDYVFLHASSTCYYILWF